jgi:histidinol-phosphate aminotransferase
MTINFKDLALPGIRDLQPYKGGKSIEEVEREYSIPEAIKLCSNENPFGLSPLAKNAIINVLDSSNRYPDGNGYHLKKKLSKKLSIESSQITLGNGSNDLLELIARAFLGPSYSAIYSQHAFLVYKIIVTAQGAKSIVVDANNWSHDLSAMLDSIKDNTRMIFIANPNNPTGTFIRLDEIINFIENVQKDILVVIDEAYFEYVDVDGYGSAIKLITHYPNIIVTRSFSKAYGLAALRVGYSISHPDIAEILNRTRQPFNVNSLALASASAILDDEVFLKKTIEINKDGYKQLTKGFRELGLDFIPSVGNFISIKTPDTAVHLYNGLLTKGIITRMIEVYDMPSHLRVSIGLPDENKAFLDNLKELLISGGYHQ